MPRPATPDGAGADDIGGGGATTIPVPASDGADGVGVEGVNEMSNPLKRSIAAAGDAETDGDAFERRDGFGFGLGLGFVAVVVVVVAVVVVVVVAVESVAVEPVAEM